MCEFWSKQAKNKGGGNPSRLDASLYSRCHTQSTNQIKDGSTNLCSFPTTRSQDEKCVRRQLGILSDLSVGSCAGWDDFCLPEPCPFPAFCRKLSIVSPHSHSSPCLPHCFSTLSRLDCYWAYLAKKKQNARTGKRSWCDLKRSCLFVL